MYMELCVTHFRITKTQILYFVIYSLGRGRGEDWGEDSVLNHLMQLLSFPPLLPPSYLLPIYLSAGWPICLSLVRIVESKQACTKSVLLSFACRVYFWKLFLVSHICFRICGFPVQFKSRIKASFVSKSKENEKFNTTKREFIIYWEGFITEAETQYSFQGDLQDWVAF